MTGAPATIVLATYNRPEHLRACLACIARLEGGPWPVIVVDDGSADPVGAICMAAEMPVLYIRQDNAGPAAARNRGAQAAETELLIFTDDDCRPRPDWALRLVEAHAGCEDVLIGGAVVNGLDENAFSAASQSILSYSYDAFGGFEEPLTFFTTNNMCVSRAGFLALDGLDPQYEFASEDRDFCYRWRAGGGHLWYCEKAIVDHFHRLDARSFIIQQFRYGRGARRFHVTVAETGTDEVKLGKARFYIGLLFHPLRRPKPRMFVRTFLIGIAHAALAVGYLYEIRQEKALRREARQEA